jgi:hypothetical protein
MWTNFMTIPTGYVVTLISTSSNYSTFFPVLIHISFLFWNHSSNYALQQSENGCILSLIVLILWLPFLLSVDIHYESALMPLNLITELLTSFFDLIIFTSLFLPMICSLSVLQKQYCSCNLLTRLGIIWYYPLTSVW